MSEEGESSPVTVRGVLALPAFAQTEVTVFAGEDDLDREVRWVHAGEIADLARFLSGGEMVLTAGLGIGQSAERQQRYVREVAEAGAAVVVVELAGRAFSAMPEAAIDEARRCGMPLVGLRDEIPFAEVSAQVHERLVAVRMQQFAVEEIAGQAFIELLLAGADSRAIVDELVRRTGHPVVLEDVGHHVLAYRGANGFADEVVSAWAAHSRSPHPGRTGAPEGAGPRAGTPAPCVRRDVVLRTERWGWVHLLHGGAEVSRLDLFALERASAAIAITLLGARESGARAAQRHGALVNRFLLGDLSDDEFVHRARGLGRDLSGRQLAVVIMVKPQSHDAGEDRSVDEGLRRAQLTAVVADLGDDILAVVGTTRDDDTAIVAALGELGAHAGISRLTRHGGLASAVRQARAAAAAAVLQGEKRVRRFDDLGLLRLLVPLAQGPELAQYVEDEIGVLLANDVTSAHPLLPTLTAFLDAGANKALAAERLYVQRRTLYYRLERIETLLAVSLDRTEVRERLIVAVRGHELLRTDRVDGGPGAF